MLATSDVDVDEESTAPCCRVGASTYEQSERNALRNDGRSSRYGRRRDIRATSFRNHKPPPSPVTIPGIMTAPRRESCRPWLIKAPRLSGRVEKVTGLEVIDRWPMFQALIERLQDFWRLIAAFIGKRGFLSFRCWKSDRNNRDYNSIFLIEVLLIGFGIG